MSIRPALRRSLRIVTATLLAAGAVAWLPFATPAQAEGTVGLAIAPAKADGPDGRTRFSYKVDPGQTVNDRVLVSNVGTKTLKITLLATDAFNAEDGSYALQDTRQKASDAGSWVRFDGGKRSMTLRLAPHESRNLAFQLAVPANASPGDHPAGVIASATFGDGQLEVERRIATRLYARVSGNLQPVLTASSYSAAYNGSWNPFDGSVTVTATIANSGNVALSGIVDVTTRTWFGLAAGTPVQAELSELLPGSSRTVSYQVNGVGQVGYVMPHLLLRSAVGADSPNPGPLPVIERDAFLIAMPWLLLVAIVAGVGVWLLLRWRRRREEQYAVEWMAQTQADAAKKAQEVDSL
jgi:hypothetical protein